MARKRKKDDDEPKKKKKIKAKKRIDDDEDLDDEEDEDNDFVPSNKPKDDAYTGMLLISFVCLIAASVFLFLDQGEVTAQPLQAPSINVPALGNAQAAAPADKSN